MSTLYKPESLLRLLPHPIREKFEEEMESCDKNINPSHCRSLPMMINYSLTWGDGIYEWDYWEKVHDRLKEIWYKNMGNDGY